MSSYNYNQTLLTRLFVGDDTFREDRQRSTADFVLSGNSEVVLCVRLQLCQRTRCCLPVITRLRVRSNVSSRNAISDHVAGYFAVWRRSSPLQCDWSTNKLDDDWPAWLIWYWHWRSLGGYHSWCLAEAADATKLVDSSNSELILGERSKIVNNVFESSDRCIVESDPFEPWRTTFQKVASHGSSSVIVRRQVNHCTAGTQYIVYSVDCWTTRNRGCKNVSKVNFILSILSNDNEKLYIMSQKTCSSRSPKSCISSTSVITVSTVTHSEYTENSPRPILFSAATAK